MMVSQMLPIQLKSHKTIAIFFLAHSRAKRPGGVFANKFVCGILFSDYKTMQVKLKFAKHLRWYLKSKWFQLKYEVYWTATIFTVYV